MYNLKGLKGQGPLQSQSSAGNPKKLLNKLSLWSPGSPLPWQSTALSCHFCGPDLVASHSPNYETVAGYHSRVAAGYLGSSSTPKLGVKSKFCSIPCSYLLISTIYIYTYIHIYIYTYIHIYIYTYIHIYIYTYIHIYIYTYCTVHIYTYIHIYILYSTYYICNIHIYILYSTYYICNIHMYILYSIYYIYI